MSSNQTLANMQKIVGLEVTITEGSHFNEKGTAIKAYIPEGKKNPAVVVQLYSGWQVMVKDAKRLFYTIPPAAVFKISSSF
jgi:hypothetical protein